MSAEGVEEANAVTEKDRCDVQVELVDQSYREKLAANGRRQHLEIRDSCCQPASSPMRALAGARDGRRRDSPAGGVYGALVYVLDFLVLTPLFFEQFRMPNDSLGFGAHVVFGHLLATFFYSVGTRRGEPFLAIGRLGTLKG